MDTLPNEVLVHHLIPAMIQVNHWDTCLLDLRDWHKRCPNFDQAFSMMCVHASKCLDSGTCNCGKPKTIHYTDPQNNRSGEMDFMAISATWYWNVLHSKRFRKHGGCLKCRFLWLLPMRLVCRRFRDAIRLVKPVQYIASVQVAHYWPETDYIQYATMIYPKDPLLIEMINSPTDTIWATFWTTMKEQYERRVHSVLTKRTF